MKEKILEEIVNNSIELMKCVTIKNNFKEFDKAFEIIKKELSNYSIREIYVNNYKNLVISNTEDKDLDIIFCGHIDVVPADSYEPEIKDGKLCGRGSFDMKSQVSVMVSLLKNNSTNKKIAFILTSDEEIGGFCCKEILKEYNSQLAVIPDAGRNFKLIVEEKGLLQINIKTKGIKAHSSEPFKGDNAVLKSLKIYNDILEKYKMPTSEKDFKTSVNLSKLNGGTTNNAVADYSEMVLDIRFTSDQNKDSIISYIEEVAVDSEVEVLDYGPTFYVDENLEIIGDFIKKASKILGKDIEIDKCLATSDAIYFSEKNIPTILINPIGNYWHNPLEYVEIDSLYTLYLIFKELI